MVLGTPYKLRWNYACTKLMDEFLALAYFREFALHTVVGRHFNTVGPRQAARYGMVIPRFVSQALEGKPLTVFGDGLQTRCFTHVSEAVKSIMNLIKSNESVGKIFNIGGNDEVSILDLAKTIIKMTNSNSKIELIPYDAVYNEDFEDMARRVPSTEHLFKVTGFRPGMNLETILTDIIEYSVSSKSGGL